MKLYLVLREEYILSDGGLITNCNAQYGAIEEYQPDLQAFVNANIETSFEFLLMSTHFGNYEANREGFKGLYRKLSDQSWADAIDLIKYIAKRGGRMDFNQLPRFKKSVNIIYLSRSSCFYGKKGIDIDIIIIYRSRTVKFWS